MSKLTTIILALVLGISLAGTVTYARIYNPLAVGNLITGGTHTLGSVIFSDGTLFAEDNSNLFWDDTNNFLGIASTTPSEELSVTGDVFVGSAATTTVFIHSTNATAGAGCIEMTDTTGIKRRIYIDGDNNTSLKVEAGTCQ